MAKTKARRAAKPVQVRDLSVEDIVTAATATIRREGFSGVSMRQLAADLEVTPPALYHHVSDKTDLLDLIADRLIASVPIPADNLPWDDRLRALLLEFERLFAAYPGLAAHAARRMESPATLRWIELVMSLLLQAGFRGAGAMRAMHVVGFYNNPATLRDVSRAKARQWDSMAPNGLDKAMKLVGGRYPALDSMKAHYRSANEEDFRFGLDLIIEGLKQELAKQSRIRTKRS
jgi:AcrR family transcriptional regulator